MPWNYNVDSELFAVVDEEMGREEFALSSTHFEANLGAGSIGFRLGSIKSGTVRRKRLKT